MMNRIRQFLWLGAMGFAWRVIAAEPVAYWRFDEGDANPVCVGTGARIVSGCGRGKSLRLDSPRARASAKAADAVPDISVTERPFTAMIRVRPDVDVVSDTMASMAKMCNSRRMTKFVEAMRDGQWHHLALVFDPTQRGREYTVYFDWDNPKSPRRLHLGLSEGFGLETHPAARRQEIQGHIWRLNQLGLLLPRLQGPDR